MLKKRKTLNTILFTMLVVACLLLFFGSGFGPSAKKATSGQLSQAITLYAKNPTAPTAIDGASGYGAQISNDQTTVTWYNNQHTLYTTTVGSSQEVTQEFDKAGYYSFTNENESIGDIIGGLLPTLIFFALIGFLLWLFFRQSRSSGLSALSFGRSKARMTVGDKPEITFNDVAGVDEAKIELAEIVEFLKFPEKFTAIGARIPKGVLLVGPPGTGKTLLAKAVAGEAGVPFFSISGSEFVEMFVGVGASRVRDLFEQAKKNSPCIVFVDEIDAVGRQRGAGIGGGHDEREQTLNQLLVEMDGFETSVHVIIIAATNRPDVLDPALLRPGRFDRHVTLDRPDILGRQAILEIHSRNKPLEPEVDLLTLAKQTPGFSGADLANLINEAAILSARQNKKIIGMFQLEEAIARVIAGPKKSSRMISEKEKQIIAYHEMGHALVGMTLEHTDPVRKVSIVSRGMALGWTLSLPTEDKYLVSKAELLDQLAQMLGGRGAEYLLLGEMNITTGASDDIRKATDLARKMVTEWGMSDKLGPRTFGERQELVFLGRDLGEQRNYSENVAAEIDQEVHHLIEAAFLKAQEVLRKRESVLKALAAKLVEVETMEVDAIQKVIKEVEGTELTKTSSRNQYEQS